MPGWNWAALADDDVAGLMAWPPNIFAEVVSGWNRGRCGGTYALLCAMAASSSFCCRRNQRSGDLDFGVVLPVARLLAMVLCGRRNLTMRTLSARPWPTTFGGDGGALERVA